MRHKIYIILSTLLILLACISCKKGYSESVTPERAMVNVKLNIRIPPVESPIEQDITRSVGGGDRFTVSYIGRDSINTRSSGTTPLNNMWIVQFDNTGAKVCAQQLSGVNSVVNDMATLDASLALGVNQTLYVVVLGKQFNIDLNTVSTISELEDMDINYLNAQGGLFESKITSDDQIPYAGRVDGVEIIQLENGSDGYVKYNRPTGFEGGILINRLAAKISFRYKYNVDGFTMTALTLKDVSANMTIKPKGAGERSPSYVALKGVNGTPNGDGSYTVHWYVAPNMKGNVNTISSESDRFSGNAPANASMIYISAEDNDTPNDYLLYEVYVGNNLNSNFDIQANSHYNMNTVIDVKEEDSHLDNRITHVSIKPDIQLYASAKSGTGSTSPSGDKYDIDSHYDFRPMVLSVANADVTVEILDAVSGALVNEADSWIKLSSSPNYTLAVRQGDLNVQASTKLIGPGSLNFYLYCDEYVTKNTTTEKRSLKVKVLMKSLSGASDVECSFTIDQRSSIYLGRFGGTMGQDGYSYGLVADQLEESNVQYKSVINGTLTGNLVWGYDKQETSVYASNKQYGKESTRLLSENPRRLMVEDGISIEPHKPITQTNGNLYQYNYYNTYAARFCYDRNRDENGNGVIDADELKWYMPAVNQLQGAWVLTEDKPSVFGNIDYFHSSTQLDNTSVIYQLFDWGDTYTTPKKNTLRVRCVRDVEL